MLRIGHKLTNPGLGQGGFAADALRTVRYSACPGATSLEEAVSPVGQVWARDFA
ncbi:MAG: hypothetical protein JRJ38_10025 [Deltaproteobacteria bacterium]|nr:hypothetical protein [Deltaproteobacteria bacterium]